MSYRFVSVMPVLYAVRGFAAGGHASRFAYHVLTVCFCTRAAGQRQALSALSLELDGHPGGYLYLCFRLRMLMRGGLRGMAAETDAISRSIASRVARSLQKS